MVRPLGPSFRRQQTWILGSPSTDNNFRLLPVHLLLIGSIRNHLLAWVELPIRSRALPDGSWRRKFCPTRTASQQICSSDKWRCLGLSHQARRPWLETRHKGRFQAKSNSAGPLYTGISVMSGARLLAPSCSAIILPGGGRLLAPSP